MSVLLLLEAVEKRRKFLHHRLWIMGVRDLSGNETLTELERFYIKVLCDRGNPKEE